MDARPVRPAPGAIRRNARAGDLVSVDVLFGASGYLTELPPATGRDGPALVLFRLPIGVPETPSEEPHQASPTRPARI